MAPRGLARRPGILRKLHLLGFVTLVTCSPREAPPRHSGINVGDGTGSRAGSRV